MSHPIKDPLPDRLLCDPNGTLSMQDGSDVKSYLASVLALHGITSPIESSLLPRLQAERMREATVHIKQLLDISTKQTTELASLRRALAAAKDEAEKAKKNEATCHCGSPMSAHGMGEGHSPVEMPEECPYAAECESLKSLAAEALLVANAVFVAWGDKFAPGTVEDFRAKEKAFLAIAAKDTGKGA